MHFCSCADSTADADVKLADFGLVASVSCDVIGGVSHEVTVKTISRDLTGENDHANVLTPRVHLCSACVLCSNGINCLTAFSLSRRLIGGKC